MGISMSRRRALASMLSATGGAGGILVSLTAPRANASDASQLRKEDVRYQEQPKGSQRCSGCKNFIGPGACRVVAGSVNPDGWCLLFQARAG